MKKIKKKYENTTVTTTSILYYKITTLYYYNTKQQIIITTSSWPVNRTLASVDAETAITLSGTLSTTSEGWFA